MMYLQREWASSPKQSQTQKNKLKFLIPITKQKNPKIKTNPEEKNSRKINHFHPIEIPLPS